MGIDPATETIALSTGCFALNIKNDIYNFKTQIAMLEEFNRNAADIYNKMLALYQGVVQMSEINVQMLKEVDNS